MKQLEKQILQARADDEPLLIIEYNGAPPESREGHFAAYLTPVGAPAPEVPVWLRHKLSGK